MALRELFLLAHKGAFSICPYPHYERIVSGRLDLATFPTKLQPPFVEEYVEEIGVMI